MDCIPEKPPRLACLEQLEPPPPPAVYWGSERVLLERLDRAEVLRLHRSVDERARWPGCDSPAADSPRAGDASRVYVLRDRSGEALGFCQFNRSNFPQVELTHFGLVPEAQGRGLGFWLLASALQGEWKANPDRIWLHIDGCESQTVIDVYHRAGFRESAPGSYA